MVAVHPVSIQIDDKLDKLYDQELKSSEPRLSIKSYQIKWKLNREKIYDLIGKSYDKEVMVMITE